MVPGIPNLKVLPWLFRIPGWFCCLTPWRLHSPKTSLPLSFQVRFCKLRSSPQVLASVGSGRDCGLAARLVAQDPVLQRCCLPAPDVRTRLCCHGWCPSGLLGNSLSKWLICFIKKTAWEDIFILQSHLSYAFRGFLSTGRRQSYDFERSFELYQLWLAIVITTWRNLYYSLKKKNQE